MSLKGNKIWLFVLFFFTAAAAHADEEHFFNSINGVHFAADSSVTVKDDKYMTILWSTIQKNINCTDIVTLQLNEDTNLYLTTPHTCRVDLEIYYYTSGGSEDSVTKTLTIAYDSTKGKAFNFRSSFKFSGGYKVTSKILAIYYDGVITGSFPKIFELDEDIFINRVYNFTCSPPSYIAHTPDYPNQQLDFSWPPELGADEYDLEWTFYDDSSYVIKNGSVVYPNFDVLYKNNATRVTINANAYNISLVYNPGYIFSRVRAAHYDTMGNRIEGPWTSSVVGGTLSSYISSNGFSWYGHEDSMNWQYTAAYAEEGKRKEVASYFDGSLRNRQSVTLNNTEQKAIVGETMYDYQGRAAVTSLPAPIDSQKIIYYNLFNVDPSGAEFNRKDFDTGDCGNPPVGMDSLLGSLPRGASGYYSSSNPDKAFEFNKYLPDAQGYPYSQTEYTPDMTGRIARQSLPGKTHYLGSGHETKYYYGKAPQEEIDRLFGNEVGDSSHYLKNMVIDANGQISVSYVDANGKTIATALAGNPPANMDSILSYHPSTVISENLLDGNTNHPNNTSILSTFGLLATNSGDYHFSYQLFPTNYLSGCSNSYCADCIYDIKLMITPACGGSPPVLIHHDTNFTYRKAFDTACSRDSDVIDTFTVYLEPGQYNITRLITVDQGAINYYTQRFFSHNTCFANYKSFLDSAIANTNFSGCNMTCATCIAALGTESAFVTKYITQLISAHDPSIHHQDTVSADSLYAVAVANCNQLCAPTNICDGLYQEMLADVSPGGQYCLYDTVGGIYKPADSTSVLRVVDFRNPITPYLDANGKPDSVMINAQMYPPQELSLNDFLNNWQSSWAASLVGYHPEYCYYIYCEKDSASNRYDADMENTTTFTAAMTAGFFNPVGDGSEPYTINWNDPYFTGGYGHAMKDTIKKHLEHYVTVDSVGVPVTLSLWRASALAVNCQADTLALKRITYSASNFGSGCVGDLNMQWDFFRGVYFSLKQHIQDSLENVYVADSGHCSSYAACIGQNISPCASTSYATKAPRHITPANVNNPDIKNWNSPAAALHAADSAMQAACDTQCKSYAYAWLAQLSGCRPVITAVEANQLVAGFEAVCEAGCNNNHPFGSSNTPGYATDALGDRDFEDVIVRVLHEPRDSVNCDSLDISMPLPYIDSNGVAGPPVSYYHPSECICNKLDSLHNHYYIPDSLRGDRAYKNFADYLNKKFGGNLTDSVVYSIMALCADTDCFFAEYPTQLPMWMTCCNSSSSVNTYKEYNSAGHVIWDTTLRVKQSCCIACSDIDLGLFLFNKISPPGTDTLSNYQTLLANFLNNMYGFNLSYSQYMQFVGTCDSIHCTVTTTYFPFGGFPDYGMRIDSTCGGVTIIDSITTTTRFLISRTVTGANNDSISPTLCNESLNTVPAPSGDTNNCITQLMNDAGYNAENAYSQYMDSIIAGFTAKYIAHCMNVDDSFSMNGPFDEYHYTLYYYDQAENLVKTIPPQGVHPITSPSSLDSLHKYRLGIAGYNPVYPNQDSLASLYWFNSLNSPVQQATPDGNITHYFYDYLGRLVLSQNAVQAPYLYSYTEYDALNRIIEVGQLSFQMSFDTLESPHNKPGHSTAPSYDSVEKMARNPAMLNFWLLHTVHTQITHTYYDSVVYHYIPLKQQNLRKRISSIIYLEQGPGASVFDTLYITPSYTLTVKSPAGQTFTEAYKYDNAIHYTYDIEGNVATQLIDLRADSDVDQRYKRTDYYYDLVSGKVNEVIYQHDTTDQFMQEYEYDADNRITDVLTSHDSLYSENDADYSYYWHGPLAREVIGRRQVQGVDYAYTLNGWIKGVNSSLGGSMQNGSTYDMGHDGDVNGANRTIGRDAYGFTLDYFNGDYRPIGGTTFEATGLPTAGLYNGNIAGATYSIKPLQPATIGYAYQYDQLNRLRAMQAYTGPDTALYNWSTGTTTSNFKESVNYDDNGNILYYIRHGNIRVGPTPMDSLNYFYNKGTNQLNYVTDGVPWGNYSNDLNSESTNNYKYNAIGELAKDDSAKIDTIIWNIYGKVSSISFDVAQDSIVTIDFNYDPLGNRIEKIWIRSLYCVPPTCMVRFGQVLSRYDTTRYSRDAQGNILAIYNRQRDSVWLNEWDIYGNKRVGAIDTTLFVGTQVYNCSCTPLSNPLDSCTIGYLEGQKQYELDNHLGNVLVTISDKKLAVDTNHDTLADYYVPIIVNAQDYYPFGMIEPGRQYQLLPDSLYRFAFNSKLHDDDIYGKDNSYDYGARFYDPRLGRFMSVDPLASKFPFYSPYQFAGNTPIQAIDIDGQEPSNSSRPYSKTNGSAVDATAIPMYSPAERQAMNTYAPTPSSNRTAMVVLDAVLLTAAIIATVASAGAASPLLVVVGVTTGTFAIATNTLKLGLDAAGQTKAAEAVPDSYFGVVIGKPIDAATGNKNGTAEKIVTFAQAVGEAGGSATDAPINPYEMGGSLLGVGVTGNTLYKTVTANKVKTANSSTNVTPVTGKPIVANSSQTGDTYPILTFMKPPANKTTKATTAKSTNSSGGNTSSTQNSGGSYDSKHESFVQSKSYGN